MSMFLFYEDFNRVQYMPSQLPSVGQTPTNALGVCLPAREGLWVWGPHEHCSVLHIAWGCDWRALTVNPISPKSATIKSVIILVLFTKFILVVVVLVLALPQSWLPLENQGVMSIYMAVIRIGFNAHLFCNSQVFQH